MSPSDTDADELLPTRRSLLTRLKNWDDQEAWRKFFEAYWKLIYRFALQAGLSPVEAEDIVQETIIGVARKMRGFHYDATLGSFKSWLLLNVRSRIIDQRRKAAAEKRRMEREIKSPSSNGAAADLLENVPAPLPDGWENLWEEEWHKNLLAAAVERVKSKISPKQFLLFDLYALKQTPARTISSAMGVSLGQVYLAKHRVARLLQHELRVLEQGQDCP